VIARQTLWKIPRKIAGVLNFKDAAADPAGARALFRYVRLRGLREVPARAGEPRAPPAAELPRFGIVSAVRGWPSSVWCRPARWKTSSAARSGW